VGDAPNWEKRFREVNVTFPEWGPGAPDRISIVSNESGVWNVHAWDRRTGSRRQVTDHPVGVTHGAPTFDGDRIAYW